MSARIIVGDALSSLRELADESAHCCITSPPYWGLRAYGGDPGMIGLEPTFDEHLDNLVDVFREVRRVLRSDGTLWLNYGDAYYGGGNGGYANGCGPTMHSEVKGVRTGKRERVPGLKPKDLMMMPARVAMALQADGWWLRSEIIWHKPNPMPESTKDRPTSAHEKVFLLSKAARYFYNAEAVRTPRVQDEDANGFRGGSYVEGTAGPRTVTGNKRMKMPDGWDTGPGGHGSFHRQGREKGRTPKDVDGRGSRLGRAPGWREEAPEIIGANLRNVWQIATAPYKEAHFATFPPALVEPCIKAGCPKDGSVLDPFAGSGTVGLVADQLGRDSILIEINSDYAEMARARIQDDAPLLAQVEAA